MKTSRSSFALRRLFASAALLCFMTLPAVAQAPKSLLPVFGTEGAEFVVKGQNGHGTKGWLPTDWKDNTEWASVTATYTKLSDAPEPGVGAVRIKVEKVDDGQLQLTTYQGLQKFARGKGYLVTGWVRSADRLGLTVGVRQKADPYEFYHEQDLSTGPEWKKFEFAFTPSAELDAFLMFVVREVGAVDLAGLTVTEKP